MNTMADVGFYLASTEGYDLQQPRRCERLGRLNSDTRSDLLLVRVDPPIIGQKYGLGSRDIHTVVLAARHRGESLFPIRKWPVAVHVARLLIDTPLKSAKVREADLQVLAWAEIYPTEQAAKQSLAR